MKKYFLSFFVSVFGFISFCSAGFLVYPLVGFTTSTANSSPFTLSDFCFKIQNNVNSTTQITVTINGITYIDQDIWSVNSYNLNNLFCYTGIGTVVLSDGNPTTNYNILFWTGFDVDFGGSCDLMTSNECQSNYNLIPISEVDQEYCLGNSLCPEINSGSGECENESGDVSWSSLFINGIQYLGKSIINIDIPDYITWDYSVDDEQFDLYVGSGYDVEYIESIIDINSYRPSSSDFTNIFVGGLTLIMPYIIFVLFLLFMRKLVKRIFK